MATREEDQIVRAHDLLVGIILGEIKIDLPQDTLLNIDVAASVLCWVLGHDHNQSFPENLAKIRSWVEEAGYEVRAVN